MVWVKIDIDKIGGKTRKLVGKAIYKKIEELMKINNWAEFIQDRVKWKEVVQKAKRTNSEVVASDKDEE